MFNSCQIRDQKKSKSQRDKETKSRREGRFAPVKESKSQKVGAGSV